MNSVTAGDIIVLCFGLVSPNAVVMTTPTIIDTMGISFSLITIAQTSQVGSAPEALAAAWVGHVTTSGSETVTVSYNAGPSAVFGYEISGSIGNIVSSTGTEQSIGSSTIGSVQLYSAPVQSIVAACGGFYQSNGLTAGTGYNIDAEFFPPGVNVDNGAEHWTSNGTPTTSQFVFAQSVPAWAEISVSISPGVATVTTTTTTTTTGTIYSTSIFPTTTTSTVVTTQTVLATGSQDLIPYLILAIAVLIAGGLIGLGLVRRKNV
ncbi:MAG: hypothetical protein ACYCPW_09635 [Nitrososphaerales archaeon]